MRRSFGQDGYMILVILARLIVKGLVVGLAWGAFVGGVIVGFFGGLFCTFFDHCTWDAGPLMLLINGIIGGVIGAAFGTAVGIFVGLGVAIQLLLHEKWLRSRHFATVVALEVAVGCAIFLPESLFGVGDESGGGLMFSAPWDAVFQLLIFKIIPTLLAAYFTWQYLTDTKETLRRASLVS